ncbi:hypothetical protein E3N88_40001 [Mikania micrantha]|uniref:Uncharacterized protein n=1 Tax=Mikania micrantha TaxID=192012 RepID=A0A5N6LLI4_9ASTR|nr:hypothetical protein E3N88_40001 [Mikania micrantha]
MEVGVDNSPENVGVAMDFSADDSEGLSLTPTMPPRLRRRLTETKASPSSVEEIEAKLRDADLRRQKFYEHLSSKARPKPRSPPQSGYHENLGQRLQAKLLAAEQKRSSILAEAQLRLTKLDRMRQATRTGAAAEKKRLELLEADMERAHARLQVRKKGKETESRIPDAESKLHNSVGASWTKKMQKQADYLSRNLARNPPLNWPKVYTALNINEDHVKSMPFEQFAVFMKTHTKRQTTKALFDRLEIRYKALMNMESGISNNENTPRTPAHSRHVRKPDPASAVSKTPVKLSRRVSEAALAEAAKKFIHEFDLLINIILHRRFGESKPLLPTRTFRSQLLVFDLAWCAYLNSFVVWKVKDAESLEEDLVTEDQQLFEGKEKKTKSEESSHVVCALFKDDDSKSMQKSRRRSAARSSISPESQLHRSGETVSIENELIVNEFVHGQHYSSANTLNGTDEDQTIVKLLKSDSLDMEYLGKILEFALLSLQKLSAPANEFTLVKGLRFVLKEIQALKQEISNARIKIVEPLLSGPAGLEYLGKAFAKRFGSPSEACIRLPLTMRWLSSLGPTYDQDWSDHNRVLSGLQDGSPSEKIVVPSTALKSGGSFSNGLRPTSVSVTDDAADNGYPECKGERRDLLVRIGLLKMVNDVYGVTQEELPETLKLNFLRLRLVQAQIQGIIVTAISILVLRQTLVTEKMISNLKDMDTMIQKCSTELLKILDTVENAGLEEIVELLSKTADGFDITNDTTKTESRRLVIARMLRKSVQAEDSVFVKVSRTVYLATRGVLFSGNGDCGRLLATMALRQVGAAVLTDRVAETGKVLGVMASVTGCVHGLWYDRLIENV